MRVDWAIPCRYAEVVPGGVTMVGAGSDVIFAPELPAGVQVLFAVRFVGAPEELDGETQHPITCRLYSPNGESMGEQRADMTSAVTQLVPGYVADLTLPIGIVLEATEHGSFAVEFQIDDSEPLRVPIHVIHPPDV